MKKYLPLFLFFLILSGLFSENSKNSLVFKSDFGWIWNSREFSVPLCAFGANFAQKNSNSFVKIDGGYFSLSSDFSKFNAKAHGGFFDFAGGAERFSANLSYFCATFPDETHIADGKPRFILKDIFANFLIGGFSYEFSEFVRFGLDGFFGDIFVSEGDLYYFYGKISFPKAFGGIFSVFLPEDFALKTGVLRSEISVKTNENVSLGDGNLGGFFFLAQKDFSFFDAHSLSFLLGYANLNFDAKISVTNKTQVYAFFPYTYLNANADGFYHLLFTGGDYNFRTRHSELNFSFGYALCFHNSSRADYDYKYKKNLFFDGSNNKDKFEMPDFEKSSLVLGKLNYSYAFEKFSHFVPIFSLQKVFVIPIFAEKTKDYFSPDSNDDKNSSSDSPSSSVDSDFIRKILLSGLTFSIKIVISDF